MRYELLAAPRRAPGILREGRGQRRVGPLGAGPRERHTGVEIAVVAVAVAGAAVSAYAAYESGQQQAAAARYNRKVAQNQATSAQDQGELAAERERERNRRLLASQRAAYGASGVITTEGSPLLVQMDSAREAVRSEQLLRYNADLAETGFRSQATLQGFYARSAERAGAIGAGASLLSGLANVGMAYYGPRATRPSSAPTQVSGV
jgi:hypothetical protein